jgi:hypothetical protein
MKKSIQKASLITATLFLSACATDKTMFYKDGQQVYVLTCNGPTFTGCLEKASNICQANGYDILDRVSVRQSGLISSTDHKEIVISCKTKVLPQSLNPTTVVPVTTDSPIVK